MTTPPNLIAAARAINDAAHCVPYGGSIRIRGGAVVSGFNLGMHILEMLEAVGRGEDPYPYLCDMPKQQAADAGGGL